MVHRRLVTDDGRDRQLGCLSRGLALRYTVYRWPAARRLGLYWRDLRSCSRRVRTRRFPGRGAVGRRGDSRELALDGVAGRNKRAAVVSIEAMGAMDRAVRPESESASISLTIVQQQECTSSTACTSPRAFSWTACTPSLSLSEVGQEKLHLVPAGGAAKRLIYSIPVGHCESSAEASDAAAKREAATAPSLAVERRSNA